MNVVLWDYDGKIPNHYLMKASTYYKSLGANVYLNSGPLDADLTICSVLYTWNREKAVRDMSVYKNVVFGGTGYDLSVVGPNEIEQCRPDYDLYTVDFIKKRIRGFMKKEKRLQKAQELVDAGIGFSSRGCVRTCDFCFVPKKEGKFRQVAEIGEIINPRSRILTLLDNNFTADPEFFPKLAEIKKKDLVIDLCQGIDVRLLTEEKAYALSRVNHLRSLHFAWDIPGHEELVFRGIDYLIKDGNFKPSKLMCFVLVGFNTTFQEDMYRIKKLQERGITPYVMVYNNNESNDRRLHHLKRWCNAHIIKSVSFEQYIPWVKEQSRNEEILLF